jgi:hypothetical protein
VGDDLALFLLAGQSRNEDRHAQAAGLRLLAALSSLTTPGGDPLDALEALCHPDADRARARVLEEVGRMRRIDEERALEDEGEEMPALLARMRGER